MKKDEKYLVESVEITNPDKLLFKKGNFTKKDIVLYYQRIAPRILPYLKERIISTIRCPDGVERICFYKKHLNIYNSGIKMINIPNDNGNKEDYYYITDITGLIAEVQMNTIEFHIWSSKIQNLEKPDMMVFDLDPDEKLDLKAVRQGVKDLKSILDSLKLTSFLKTSGGKGYHVVVPIRPSISWADFRRFAKNIAQLMEEKWPERYTSNVRKINRKNKIFVDWMRNIKGATSVAPYSVRTKKNATVSMPIAWNELNQINPDGITIDEAIKRIYKKDPWANFYQTKGQIKTK